MPNKDLYQEILGKIETQEPQMGSLYLESARVDNLQDMASNMRKLHYYVETLNKAGQRPDRLVRVIWNVENWIVTLPFWYTTLRTRELDEVMLAEVEVYTPNVYAQRSNLRFQLLPGSSALMELCLGSDLRVIPAGLIAEMHRTFDSV